MVADNQTGTLTASTVNICEGFPYLTKEIQQQLNEDFFPVLNKFFIAINVVLSPITTCMNALILISIWKTVSLHSPSHTLLANLALSDLGIGLFVLPSFIVSKSFQISKNLDAVCFVGSLAESLFFVIAGVSFFTLTCIAVNQFLVLYFHLRYNSLINMKETKITLAFVWILNIGLGVLRFKGHSINMFCSVAIVVVATCLLVTSVCYLKILKIIARHRKQINLALKITYQMQDTLSFPKYKRSVNTMLLIWLLYLVCYTPLLCLLLYVGATAERKSSKNIPIVGTCIVTMTMAGSCLNPVVYCLRIAELRCTVIKTAREILRLKP
ncbi:adenosine receptor A2b-like [Actinia tenebrosa]|uniref:Adenosine receptor A2b-like n=1 Tax=Actinia tenebrosa TaxID=6105 RepID=A0A6P8I9Q5_ACTTE|nr:adenosine receptor A2b-like [Actinia tenebrosa]